MPKKTPPVPRKVEHSAASSGRGSCEEGSPALRRTRFSSVPLVHIKHNVEVPSPASVELPRRHVTFYSDSDSSGGGLCSTSDTMESFKDAPSVRIKHLTRNSDSRFPKLDECAHFHYDNVELGPVEVCLSGDEEDQSIKGVGEVGEMCVRVSSNGKSWQIRRSLDNFLMLDRQLHRCVYDRKFSLLQDVALIQQSEQDALREMLTQYLERFSQLAGSLINCGPVLNWLELDNRGNRLIVTDEAAINTPAVAAAYVTKRYASQAPDEISLEVGDIISVIDMPPTDESSWWRGKKGFQVGFFPCECVEIIGDKVPQSFKIPKAPSKPVLRKHGKLIAFFRSFLLSRPSRRKLKQSGILKERVFGCDLGEHLMNSARDIPLVLKCCTEFIEQHGIVDGIYRLSGVTSNIQKLRLAFDEERVPDLCEEAILQDIHCVASLLKMYFRELPNPLLTFHLYDKFVSAVQADESTRLLRLRDVVRQLPPPHYRSLEFLMRHLSKVAAHGPRTGMTPKNVAIVWAPNLLRSRDVENGGVGALHVVGVQAVLTEYLIRYMDIIFSEKMPVFPSPKLNGETTPKKARPKSLAISTPTKLLSLEEARSRAHNPPDHPQRYIDVGGGEENLPLKYHTVIDLPPSRRRSMGKKSPSGWKSFFSRGSSGRRKGGRERPKIGSPVFLEPLQNKAVTESDVSHSKKLRTVKSAEALFPLDSSFDNSKEEDHLTEEKEEEDDAPHLSNLSISSSKHRSISHDSYFERYPESDPPSRRVVRKQKLIDLPSPEASSPKLQKLSLFPDPSSPKLQNFIDLPSSEATKLQKLIDLPSPKASKLQKLIDLPSSEATKLQKLIDLPSSEATKLQKLIDLPSSEATKLQKLIDLPSPETTKLQKLIDFPSPETTKLQNLPSTVTAEINQQRGEEDSMEATLSESGARVSQLLSFDDGPFSPLWTPESQTGDNLSDIPSSEDDSLVSDHHCKLQIDPLGESTLPSPQKQQSSEGSFVGDIILSPPESFVDPTRSPDVANCVDPIRSQDVANLNTASHQDVANCMNSFKSQNLTRNPDVAILHPVRSRDVSMDSSRSPDLTRSPDVSKFPDIAKRADSVANKGRPLERSKTEVICPPKGGGGMAVSGSFELFKASDFFNKRSSCSDKSPVLSPLEDTKRKFESEIGRLIVRDRQMKLEMERMKVERQKKSPSSSSKGSDGSSSSRRKPEVESTSSSASSTSSSRRGERKPELVELQKSILESSSSLSSSPRMKAELVELQRSISESSSSPRRKPDLVESSSSSRKPDLVELSPVRLFEGKNSEALLRKNQEEVRKPADTSPSNDYSRYIRMKNKPSVKELLSKFESQNNAPLEYSQSGVFSNVQVNFPLTTSKSFVSSLEDSHHPANDNRKKEHIFQTECVIRFPHPKKLDPSEHSATSPRKDGGSFTSLTDTTSPRKEQQNDRSFTSLADSGGRSFTSLADTTSPRKEHQNGGRSFTGSLRKEQQPNERSFDTTSSSRKDERSFRSFADTFHRATAQMRTEFLQRGLPPSSNGFDSTFYSRSPPEVRKKPNVTTTRQRPKSVPPPVCRLGLVSNGQGSSSSQTFGPPKRVKDRAAIFERSLSFSGDKRTPRQKGQTDTR